MLINYLLTVRSLGLNLRFSGLFGAFRGFSGFSGLFGANRKSSASRYIFGLFRNVRVLSQTPQVFRRHQGVGFKSIRGFLGYFYGCHDIHDVLRSGYSLLTMVFHMSVCIQVTSNIQRTLPTWTGVEEILASLQRILPTEDEDNMGRFSDIKVK